MPPKQTAASKAVTTKLKKHLMDELSEDEAPKAIESNPAPTPLSSIISTGFEHPASGGGAAQTPANAVNAANIDAEDVIVIADGSDEDAEEKSKLAFPAQVQSPKLNPEAHPYVPQSPPQELSEEEAQGAAPSQPCLGLKPKTDA